MSNDKGKGRATAAEAREEDSTNSQLPSLISRVAASASGLTKDVFGKPNSNELHDHVTTGLANSGKGQASRDGVEGSASAEGSRIQSGPSFASASTGLRAGHKEEHVKQSEAEFSSFLDGIGTFIPSEEPPSTNLTTNGETTENTFEKAWPGSYAQPSRTVVEQEMQDGHDVLQILDDPSYEKFSAPSEDDENYDWGLTTDQISKLREMTKDILPSPENHSSMPAEHSLNLIPISDPQFLTSPGVWREQWTDVLNRYTDEVWGGLLPIVKEARAEVEELSKEGPSPQQPKALRRLEAILGHLQRR